MMGGMKRKIRCGGRPMTAIVLAGGRGTRMKADKAGLLVGGRTLLEHVLAQIEPYFDEIIVSISKGQGRGRRPAPLGKAGTGRKGDPQGGCPGLRLVEDERPGCGPIGGVMSGLRAARNDACAVIACDIPDIDIALLRSLARAADGVDIAVPVGPSGLHEPLFAIYRRPVILGIESLLAQGERSILPLYDRCRTSFVRLDDAIRLRNLNTRRDYETYLGSIEGRPAGRDGARGAGTGRGRRRKRIPGAQSPGRGTRP
jgi:molybdopterin-guanine dinucleotide biosynthesis protein A